jgi:hypothetical protein
VVTFGDSFLFFIPFPGSVYFLLIVPLGWPYFLFWDLGFSFWDLNLLLGFILFYPSSCFCLFVFYISPWTGSLPTFGQDLKDFVRSAGEVTFADVDRDGRGYNIMLPKC